MARVIKYCGLDSTKYKGHSFRIGATSHAAASGYSDTQIRVISRAQPTLKLPCISPQSSVTCNGEYRRPVIKALPSFHDVDAENGERKLYVI